MQEKRIDIKLKDGLWKIYFFSQKGRPCTWIVFTDDPRRKTIAELTKLSRLGKGKTLKQVFAHLGIGYIPRTKRLQKKKLTNMKE